VTLSIRPLAVFVLLFFSPSIFGQRVEDGWKGLLPFKSTKAEIEKSFGEGKKTDSDRHYQYEYKSETATFRVDYSGDPCDSSSDSLDRYDLPRLTILRYEVQLFNPVPLKEFTFDVNRFERTVMIYGPSNEPWATSYLQWEFDLWKVPNQAGAGNGIEIQVTTGESEELVTGFRYGPPYDKTKFRCLVLK
jgi:hypothetical protein